MKLQVPVSERVKLTLQEEKLLERIVFEYRRGIDHDRFRAGLDPRARTGAPL